MNIKVPRRLQIGGHVYTVEYNERLEKEDKLWGTHNHKDLKIEIYPHISSTVKAGTLLHEVLHAIALIYTQSEVEDEKVQSMSEGILQIMTQMGITFDWSDIK